MKKGRFVRVKNSTFEGNNYVGNLSHLADTYFGKYSYCGSRCELVKVKVGRFCSIASKVEVVYGKHPTRQWVSTHPVFYSKNNSIQESFVTSDLFEEKTFVNETNYYVVIGNDVWIGHGVQIMEGITIGDGAIVAAGSIVTSDVPPYSIFGGNPAKLIRMRFSDDEIDFLKEIQWWNRDEAWIRNYHDSFSDIEELMGRLKMSK